MKFLASLVIVAVVLVNNVSFSAPPSFEQFFDAVLKALIQQKGDLIDPLRIEDQTVILTPDVLKFLPHFVKPEVDLKDIYLKGLKTLHRSGSAMQSINPRNNKVTVAELAITPLEVDTKVVFHFLGMFIGRPYIVTASNFDFFVEFEANKTHKTIVVPRFEVKEMKDFTVKVNGTKVTDKLTNHIMSHAVPLLKKKIIAEVEKAVQDVLETKINELPEATKQILY